MPEDHEMLVEDLLWVKIRLQSGHELRLREITGPIEEGNMLEVDCINGQLKLIPEAANAITIEALGFGRVECT